MKRYRLIFAEAKNDGNQSITKILNSSQIIISDEKLEELKKAKVPVDQQKINILSYLIREMTNQVDKEIKNN